MKVKLLYWDRGTVGGWEAAVEVDGKRHKVPGRYVSGGLVSFDSQAQAKRHAIAFAKQLVRAA